MRARLALLALACLAAPALAGCGFTPLYAVADTGGQGVLRQVKLAELAAGEAVEPVLARAFETRTALDDAQAEYELRVTAREKAERLAVQIDASVTRYNYLLQADYTLTRYADGKTIRGRAKSVASFNIVASQYSTLFAEKAAREKAARALVEDIERSILMRLAQEAETERAARAAAAATR